MIPGRLELDFVAPRRRPRWLGYALLAASLLMAADLTVRFLEAQQEISRVETTTGLLGAERAQPKPIAKERLDEQIKTAQAIVRQLTLPWAVLIQALEDAATGDVAILQLQPEAQQRLLRVVAEARSQEAMFEYLRRLEHTQPLWNVHLVGHQVQLEDPQRPIQFSVQAAFREAP
jgi:Tfp pilus assembly protein PilN